MLQGIVWPLNFNSICYLGLCAFSAALLAFTYFQSKNARCLLLFLGMAGVGYTIEYFIYVILGSYAYEPKIISRDAYFDNNMGAIASNFMTLPATAVFLATFRLNWLWIAGVTCLILGIEWLFLHWGIYRHYWWRTGYTALGLPLYYAFARLWLQRLMLPLKGVRHYWTLAAIVWTFCTLQFLPVAFLGSRYYTVGWFSDRSRDTTAFSSASWMIYSCFFAWMLRRRWRYAWLKYTLPAAVVLAVNLILARIGLLHSVVWWDYLFCIIVTVLLLVAAGDISRRLRNGPG